MDDPWNPEVYDTFAAERAAPFHDLVDLLRPVDSPTLVDLGCGTGRLTVELAERTGARQVWGLDNSEAMLAEALALADGSREFVLADIGAGGLVDLVGERVDIVVSNAALHWMPDHRSALDSWIDLVAPGGQIAIQVPANSAHASHRLADEVAAGAEFRDRFESPPPPDPTRHILAPAAYAEILYAAGFPEPRVRQQVYPHVLGSARDIVTWMRATSFTRFRSRLDDETYAEFERRYEDAIVAEFGDTSPYLFTFTRVLMWGGDRRP